MILTNKHDPETNVAMRLTGGAFTRYFNGVTLKSNSLGKSGKIALLVDTIEIFMQQGDKDGSDQ